MGAQRLRENTYKNNRRAASCFLFLGPLLACWPLIRSAAGIWSGEKKSHQAGSAGVSLCAQNTRGYFPGFVYSSFFILSINKRDSNPERVFAWRKQFSELFLAPKSEAGTVAKQRSPRTQDLRSKAVSRHSDHNTIGVLIRKGCKLYCDLFFFILLSLLCKLCNSNCWLLFFHVLYCHYHTKRRW